MGCFFQLKVLLMFYIPFQDNGVEVKNTLQIRLRVMSCEVKGLVAAKSNWVDPTSFVAMNSNTLLYFTKLSGKSQDFYFLVGTHLKQEYIAAANCLCFQVSVISVFISRIDTNNIISIWNHPNHGSPIQRSYWWIQFNFFIPTIVV